MKRKNKVFLTGGTGFVGSSVLNKLLQKGYDVTVLVRKSSKDKLNKKAKVFIGDVTNKDDVVKGSKGCDVLVNLVGIIREFPQKGITFDRMHTEATFNCVMACQENGIPKIVQMSALGTSESAKSDYHKTKHQAEVLVQESGLDHTIVRPGVIFGKGDQSINSLVAEIKKGLVPIIGDGDYKWQPVAVEDVAKIITQAIEAKENKVIELGGPKKYSYNELIDMISLKLGKNPFRIRVPFSFKKIPTKLFGNKGWFPIGESMLTMLAEDNTTNNKVSINLKKLEKYIDSLR